MNRMFKKLGRGTAMAAMLAALAVAGIPFGAYAAEPDTMTAVTAEPDTTVNGTAEETVGTSLTPDANGVIWGNGWNLNVNTGVMTLERTFPDLGTADYEWFPMRG